MDTGKTLLIEDEKHRVEGNKMRLMPSALTLANVKTRRSPTN